MNLAPDYVAPIIGYRAWRFHEFRMDIITSLTMRGHRWFPHTVSRISTSLFLANGFYAWKSPYELERFRQRWDIDYWSPYIYGTVSLWGKVAEHVYGYRAEFAYPHRFEGLVNLTACGGMRKEKWAECSLAIVKEFNERWGLE